MAIEIPIDNRSIVQLRQDLVQLRTQIQNTTNPAIIKQFEEEIVKVNDAIVQQAQNYDAAGKSVTTLRKEFKAFQDLAAESTDRSSAGFQSIARASGQARDEIKATNEQINQFAAGTVFEQAQLQLGGIKEGLLSLDFDKVSESAANLSNTIKSSGNLKAIFGDIGGAVKNLGNVFAQVGKVLLTNPIFLLATVIAVIVIALVAFLDKVGLLKKAIELLTLPLKLVMGLLTSVTDALGLTAEAQKAYAATTIKEGEKIRAEIDRQEKQQLAFYNVTKNLTDKEIADLQKRTGVVIDTTQSEFDIRQKALDDRIAQNDKEIAALQAIAKSTAGLTEDEQKQLDERLKQQVQFKDQSIQIEVDRTSRISQLNTSLNDQLDRIRAQNITNETARNKALNDLDKQAALDRIDNQIRELQRLGQSTEQAEALRTETITFFANKETQIRRDASKKAFSEAQKAASDRLKAIQDEENLKIESLAEGTSQRIIAEEAAGNRILEFQRKNAKLLGLTSNQLALLEIQNRDQVQKKWDEYNTLVAGIENNIALNSRLLAIETAKTTEDRIAAEVAYEKEKARIEGELLKQSIQERIKAAEGDEALQQKIREDGIKELELFWQQRNNIIIAAQAKEVQEVLNQDAQLAQIAADAAMFDAMAFQGRFQERLRLIEEAFKKERELLEKQKQAELFAAEGDEIKLAEIREKYRQAELVLDQNQEDFLREQRAARIDQFLKIAEQGLTAVSSLANLVLDLESENLKEGTKEAEAAARKKFEINKAFQIGAAIIDGFKAANASLAQSPIAIGPVPNPAGIASLAFSIATSAANVIKIAAQQYKSKGGGGGGTPAGGGAGAVAGIGGAGAAVPSFNLFGQGNIGGATQATPETQTQQQITVKAVVVESDVTQTQKNVSAIESASEL